MLVEKVYNFLINYITKFCKKTFINIVAGRLILFKKQNFYLEYSTFAIAINEDRQLKGIYKFKQLLLKLLYFVKFYFIDISKTTGWQSVVRPSPERD